MAKCSQFTLDLAVNKCFYSAQAVVRVIGTPVTRPVAKNKGLDIDFIILLLYILDKPNAIGCALDNNFTIFGSWNTFTRHPTI